MIIEESLFKTINPKIIDKVDDYIKSQRQQTILFNEFLLKIEPLGEIFIVGGAIRDISINKAPNDIDLIIDTTPKKLEPILNMYKHSLNRFGGYRFNFDKIIVDLWLLQDHWIFQKRPLKHSITNISKGALLNINSAVVNLSKRKLYCKYYNLGVKNNTYQLDFTIKNKKIIKENIFLKDHIKKTVEQNSYFNLSSSKEVGSFLHNGSKYWQK